MKSAAEKAKDQLAQPCFACGAKMFGHFLVDTRDAQTVYVGVNCFEKIRKAGDKGWQPPKGGPRLYLLPKQEA